MGRSVYDVEIDGLSLTASWNASINEAFIRVGDTAVVFDDSTDQFALVHATYDLARVIERAGRGIEDAQGHIPFVFIDGTTNPSEALHAYERSFLLTEFFRYGLATARFAQERIISDPSVRIRIEDLIIELDHAYVLGARSHEAIREAIDRTIPTEQFSSGMLE